jgi:uncharacterized membrane protein YdjX (TVP38/TMEM64 family)
MTSKEVLGSNPLACKGKPCLPFATELDLGLPMGLLVGSAVVLISLSLSLSLSLYIYRYIYKCWKFSREAVRTSP